MTTESETWLSVLEMLQPVFLSAVTSEVSKVMLETKLSTVSRILTTLEWSDAVKVKSLNLEVGSSFILEISFSR